MSETRVLYPEPVHVCDPNWIASDDGRYMVGTELQWVPEGTIYECSCGRLIVAYRPYDNVLTNSWRPACWRERRRFRRAGRES